MSKPYDATLKGMLEWSPADWPAWVLMGLRYERELIDRLLQGVIAMEESVTYQAIIRKGRAEGMAEGRREEAQRNILLLGRKHLGEPGAETTAALGAIADVDRLEQLLLRVNEVAAWEDLLGLPAKRARRRKPKR